MFAQPFVIAAALLAAGEPAEKPLPHIPFPHPVITEVLFAVPSGVDGDANADGKRDATGDEFIELMNPHDKPIQLAGYTLTDRNPEPARQCRFVFPECVLQPRQVAVVFNGHNARFRGPVGDATRPPEGPNPNFGGAFVFTMRIESRTRALSNSGDFVLLTDPDGHHVEAVVWGASDPRPPEDTIRINEVPAGVLGSVQRTTPDGPMLEHPLIDDTLFSPGVIPTPPAPAPPSGAAPGPKK